MKVLCVFTNKFPYTTVEPYLESEVLHYGGFDKVYVFSLIVKKSEENDKREVPDFVEVHSIRNDKLRYIVNGLKTLFDSDFRREIARLKTESRLTMQRFLTLLIYISRSHVDAKKICRLMKGKLNSCDVVFYTYRFEYQPYMALLVKKNLKLDHTPVLSRAHRYDLYEERAPGEYIPLRNYLLENLKSVYPCSKDGKQYLWKKFPAWKNKVSTRYLGTVDYGVEEYTFGQSPFRIVSCSNITRVKRLDRIIDALSQIKSKEVEWIHFGSGEEEADIRRLSAERLGNLRVIFKGRQNNREILRYYKENKIDLFINLSDSEGLPVSIMEAMSCGIPCMATDVGGTSEIVVNGYNGVLLDPSEENAGIARKIDEFISLKQEDYLRLRDQARKTWNDSFNAESNYKYFVDELLQIAAQGDYQ